MRSFIASFLILFTITLSFSQETKIDFKLSNGKLESDNDLQKEQALPLKMTFHSGLRGKTLEIRTSNGQPIYKGIFGQEINKIGEESFYSVVIDKDKLITAVTDPGEVKINENRFTLNLKANPNEKIPISITQNNTVTESVTEASINHGNIIQDAIYINKHLKPNTENGAIQELLAKHYGIKEDNINENKFLNEQLKDVFTQSVQGATDEDPTKSENNKSSALGFSVATIADGFARFIVKRTKQELSIAFFQKFKEKLNDDKIKDLRTIFPETHKTLELIDDEIYMFQAYIQTLREVFEKDLKNILANLPKIIENHSDYFDKNPTLKASLQTGFYLAKSFKEKQHPGLIIENYDGTVWDEVDDNFNNAFQTIILLSKSLKSNDDSEKYWVGKSDIEKLFSKDKLFKIYLGLLIQKSKDIKFGKATLSEMINNSYDKVENVNAYRNFVKGISLKAGLLEEKVKLSRTIQDKDDLFENYHTIVSIALELIEETLDVETLPYFPKDIQLKKAAEKYLNTAQITSDIALEIHRRNYASVVVNTAQLVTSVLGEEGKEAKEAIFKYGSFMAAIAEAKNSEEVSEIIETFALPVGSSRIKRKTSFNVSLNAYCGVFGGIETIKGVDDNDLNSYGITAPIGFAISKGNIGEAGWSTSLFVSVVDLGALAAFRFENDDVESVPNFELKDIISPGAFFSLGIPNSPISINAGWQVGPLLRKVNLEENTFGSSYNRFSVSVTVDIPILNLYSRSK